MNSYIAELLKEKKEIEMQMALWGGLCCDNMRWCEIDEELKLRGVKENSK